MRWFALSSSPITLARASPGSHWLAFSRYRPNECLSDPDEDCYADHDQQPYFWGDCRYALSREHRYPNATAHENSPTARHERLNHSFLGFVHAVTIALTEAGLNCRPFSFRNPAAAISTEIVLKLRRCPQRRGDEIAARADGGGDQRPAPEMIRQAACC